MSVSRCMYPFMSLALAYRERAISQLHDQPRLVRYPSAQKHFAARNQQGRDIGLAAASGDRWNIWALRDCIVQEGR